MVSQLDHLVLAVPDLATAVADFAARTGVMPAPGGSHVGRGTANHLVGLGAGAYLEIIGPDPGQPEHTGPRPFGVDAGNGPRLITWAIRPDNLDDAVTTARAQGYDPGEVSAMSRRTQAGDLLEWRLTPGEPGVVPFLIDWGTTTHPATGLPSVELVALTAEHPNPHQIQRILAALETDLDVTEGAEPELRAVLDTPNGRVEL